MAAVLVACAGLVLLVAWLSANRREVQRGAATSDWEGTEGRPELWTSAARCPACASVGGLLETEGDQVVFVCLACGERHRRDTRG